jgi:hypothetical protein
MTARAPTDSVPDPVPPPEEGSLVTFLALLDDCERDPNAMYEPWSPKAGDRVVCTPSPECCVAWGVGVPNGHPAEETGAIGAVVAMPDRYRSESWRASHPYAVTFDYPGVKVNGELWWGGMFAAIELALLEDCERSDAHQLGGCSRRSES